MKNHEKILIIRLSAIGDVVFASSFLKALRKTCPNARISWLVEPAAAPLLKNNSSLDEVIILPRAWWKQLWYDRRFLQLYREIRDFIRMLRSKCFDIVYDIQGLIKSSIWAFITGAGIRIGMESKEWSRYLMTQVISFNSDNPRICSEYLEMAEALGLAVEDFSMDLPLGEEDEAYAADFNNGGNYAVICPFTTRPQKHWVEYRWPELAREIMAQQGMRVVMQGGPGHVEEASRIHSANDMIINLVGKSSIMQTAAIIKYASLVIGVDTGFTHMGIVFNVPTLVLLGSTCSYLDTTRDNARALYHKVECSPCRRNPTCNNEYTCMKRITVEEIMANIKEVTA